MCRYSAHVIGNSAHLARGAPPIAAAVADACVLLLLPSRLIFAILLRETITCLLKQIAAEGNNGGAASCTNTHADAPSTGSTGRAFDRSRVVGVHVLMRHGVERMQKSNIRYCCGISRTHSHSWRSGPIASLLRDTWRARVCVTAVRIY